MPTNHMETDDEENYFVTMTDMMVGLLFIFLIMVAFFAYKLSKQVDREEMVPQELLIEAQNQRDSLQLELDVVSSQLQVTQEQLKEVRVERDLLLEQVSDLTQEKEELLTKLKKVTEQRDLLQSELDTLITLRDQLQTQITVLTVQASKYDLEIEKLKADLEESKKQRNILQSEKNELQKKLDDIRLNSLARFNEASRDSRRQILFALQQRLKESDQSIDVSTDYERGILRLQGVDLFASGSTQLLNPETVRLLARTLEFELGCFIYDYTPPYDCSNSTGFVEAVYVEGHTDNVPLGSQNRRDGIRDNLQLSARRASNTYTTMIEASPQIAQFGNPVGQSVMSVSAYGEQRPLVSNDTRAGRNKNRRIDLRLEMYSPRDEAEVAELGNRQNESIRPTLDNTLSPSLQITQPPSNVTWEEQFPNTKPDIGTR